MVTKYSADAIHGDLYYTLQDDAEFVLASDYAALEAELARVKAESLRVVPDGEAVELDMVQRHQYVQHQGCVCVPDKLQWQLVRITDNHRYHVSNLCADSSRFQPVRLERWEATDVLGA